MDLDVLSTFSPPRETCDRYYTENNRTYFIFGGYEGIPENLLINFVVWLVLLVLFSLLRKIAWDYGRIALVSRTEARWTSLFYGDHVMQESRSSQESLDTLVNRQDKGFCSWIPAFFKIKDEHILQKSGRDAVQYLNFQRYLIFFMAIVTFFCIAVILPVNFMGTLEGTTQTFGHTTISNVNTNSPTLWVHAVLSVLMLVISVLLMRRFSVKLKFDEEEHATRTLMVSNIPSDACFRNIILQHFQEAYPEEHAVDVQFAYNITKLVSLDAKRQRALEGLIQSEAIYKQTGTRPPMVPFVCGQCCCCCDPCGCIEVDAIEYYSHEESTCRAACESEKVNAFRNTLGIGFVTFDDSHMASRVRSDFAVSCRGAHNPRVSSVSSQLGVHNWVVKYAPPPDNIYWENLSVSDAMWWVKAILINFIVIVILFFLTTPSIVINLLNQSSYNKAVEELSSMNPLMAQFVPVLILWLVSVILPTIVYWSDQFIGHWTRSAEHHAVMRKTFIFLLLMVLILPSLGLTSAKALVEWFSSRNEKEYKFRWQCIFIPDNGAFFVNYIITSAFIGTAAELIRIPELFMYGVKLLMARSAAERTTVRKSALWPFQFGMQYAWMLCVFSVAMAYSIVCPLITPFGLIYLIMKHLVDRYNIYFAYAPSRINKNIHTSAINFVIIGVILLQCTVVFFTILRTEKMMRPVTIFSTVALIITLTIFSGRLCCGWFKGFSPITYTKFQDGEEQPSTAIPIPQETKPFIPSVLLGDQVAVDYMSSVPGDSGATNLGYGAIDSPTHSNNHQATMVSSTGEVTLYEAPPST